MKQVDVFGVVILNANSDVLCVLRSQTMSLPGLWEFPGSKLEPCESLGVLKHEIHEEPSCQVNVKQLVVSRVHLCPNVIIRLRIDYAQLVSGTPKTLEHVDLRWVQLVSYRHLNVRPKMS